MITFEESNNQRTSHASYLKVKLDGKHVGNITGNFINGYQYRPLKQKTGGEMFPTLNDCKESLK